MSSGTGIRKLHTGSHKQPLMRFRRQPQRTIYWIHRRIGNFNLTTEITTAPPRSQDRQTHRNGFSPKNGSHKTGNANSKCTFAARSKEKEQLTLTERHKHSQFSNNCSQEKWADSERNYVVQTDSARYRGTKGLDAYGSGGCKCPALSLTLNHWASGASVRLSGSPPPPFWK